MSEADRDIIIGRVTRKIISRLVIPVLVILLGQGGIIFFSQKNKADEAYVAAHYRELYRLTAELATTQAEYIKANDKEKELLWDRINYLIERMDKFADHDVKRGITKDDTVKREYGLEFTPLL